MENIFQCCLRVGLFIRHFCYAATYRSGGNKGAAVDTRIEQNQVVKVKNVWETLEWVGRRPEELKLAGAEASGNTGIDFSGDWYGHVVKGTAYVKKNYSSPQREAVVYEIFFTDDLPYYDAMIRDIEKRYGKPYIQAEEPYVESNGVRCGKA